MHAGTSSELEYLRTPLIRLTLYCISVGRIAEIRGHAGAHQFLRNSTADLATRQFGLVCQDDNAERECDNRCNG